MRKESNKPRLNTCILSSSAKGQRNFDHGFFDNMQRTREARANYGVCRVGIYQESLQVWLSAKTPETRHGVSDIPLQDPTGQRMAYKLTEEVNARAAPTAPPWSNW